MASIFDGTTNTYMAGEKYLSRDHYYDGVDISDDHSMLVGDDFDLHAWVLQPPTEDRRESHYFRFGSAHPGGWQVVLCDGSVRTIDYSVDLTIHRRFGNRHDGEP